MILTSQLAQQIVDNIMPIVHQNVNIMNDAGIIIGSGQKHRLGTFHKGAKDVIETGAVVEIFPEDLARYPGSLPGLNWPIVLGEQTVGVVGVTGHPDAVRNTAELVKMVAELILERETLMGEFRAQSHLHEQFATLLLSEHAAANYPQLEARAQILKFDLALPRLVAVANVSSLLESAYSHYGSFDLVSARTQESLLQRLRAADIIAPADMVAFLENRMIILKHFPPATGAQPVDAWGAAFVRLIGADNPAGSLRLGLGSLVGSPLKLRDSYQEALFALENARGGQSIASIYDFGLLASYLLRNPRGLATCNAVKDLQEKLTARIDAKYDMRNTVRHLLDNNLNLSLTAKALFIHRNTLVFRLKKLQQLTGLDPGHDINHAILCKILCG